MNFHELYRKIEAIDKGQSLDEFLGFGKKQQPATAPGNAPTLTPGQSAQSAPGQSAQPAPGQSAQTVANKLGGMSGNAAKALSGRQAQLTNQEKEAGLEEGDKEDESDEEWYDSKGRPNPNGAYDAGGHYHAERDAKESKIAECGMMAGPMDSPKQQDSVTMNVSMNGSGAGGIRDLLNVLKDIQDGPTDSMPGDDMDIGPDMDSDADAGPDVLLKKSIDSMSRAIDDDFANSMPGASGPKIGGLDMVTHDGDDLHKQKSAYPKASGGDNAMKLKDGASFTMPAGDIKIKLESLYQEILKRESELSAKKYKKQGVTEGLSKRDQKDVAAIKAAIGRLQAQLSHPNADKAAIQQRIAHEKKRLALYGEQGVTEGSTDLTDIWQAGKEAAYLGKSMTSCPYKMFSKEWEAWYRGWQDQNAWQDVTEGSGPKEKEHSKYVNRNSPESKAKAQAALDQMAKDKAAEPGKKLLSKIKAK